MTAMTSTMAIADEAVVWSVSQAGRADALATRPLLVLMHGRGSHEHDLFALAPLLPSEAVIASLRAPLQLGDNFSWFPAGDPGLPSPIAAAGATEAVLEWLDTVPSAGPVWLLGFSQGGAMATQLMRFAPERFTAAVILSGFVIAGELPGDATLEVSRPPMFWGRDPVDPVITQAAVQRTAEWLPAHSSLTMREYAAIGHSISREELDDVNAFLRASISGD
jgi:phospholipase/carboxylesterase